MYMPKIILFMSDFGYTHIISLLSDTVVGDCYNNTPQVLNVSSQGAFLSALHFTVFFSRFVRINFFSSKHRGVCMFSLDKRVKQFWCVQNILDRVWDLCMFLTVIVLLE